MTIEIVPFPIKMEMFHSYVAVHQSVEAGASWNHIQLGGSNLVGWDHPSGGIKNHRKTIEKP